MKVKSIIAALLLMVAGLQSLWAQKVVVYKTNSQTIEYEVSDVDSIVFVEKPVKLITKIELSETTITLQPNETKTLTAIVLPEDADNKAVKWESSDEGVATVEQTGEVKAVAAGECTIIAKATDGSGVKAECTIIVVQLVTAITLEPTTLSLPIGANHTLTANIQPFNATNKDVYWESSNTSIATIEQKGKVTAVAVGTCTIACSAKDGSGVKGSCTVTVKSINVELGLPVSTMLSPEKQWAADIMVFNDPERYDTDAAGQVIDTPPSDTSGNNWYDPNYQLTNGQESWNVGYSPFLSEVTTDKIVETPWNLWPNSTVWSADKEVADIYLRRTFIIDQALSDRIFLSCCHDDNAEWYLNGVLIHSIEGYIWNYDDFNEQVYLTADQIALIHTDGTENVLAIHVHNYGGPALADGGLYEKEIGLPTSTMVSPKIQWAADIMVFNDTERWGTDAAGQVIDTPPSDTSGNNWYDPNYQLTNGQESWNVGYSPFLAEEFDERTDVIPWIIWPNSTRWSTGQDVADIYLRRTFTVDHALSDKIFLSCCHDDNAEWYLNGVLIYSTEGWNWDYSYDNEQIYLTAEQCALIHTDGKENVLAIHVHNYDGPALADGGLYEKEIGLPTSTMVSPKIQWVADMMVFNDIDRGSSEANYQVIDLPPSDTNGNEWYAKDYQLTDGQKSWSVGYSPFLTEKLPGEEKDWTVWPNSTKWSADNEVADIYLRRTFTVNHELSNNIFLSCCYDNGAEWYLNGVLIHSTEAGTWSYDKEEKIYLTPAQRALIHTDGSENVLAIHVHNDGGPGFADGGLYEEGLSGGNHEGIQGELDIP